MAMTVENVLRIDAPPERVWRVTVDVERWPEWTPTVTRVRRLDPGEFRLGSIARIKQPMQPESEWRVTEFVQGSRFAWETRRRGLRMTGTHELEAEGAGTRSRLSVRADGPLTWLLWPLLRPAMAKAIAKENRGLKSRCEDEEGAT